nr:hypothetical protein [Tanacetum cinerariifolium]
DSGGNPPPVTIHTWLELFNKQKPRLFEKATAPVDAENWMSHIEKIFDVMGCEDAFKTRLAVYKFEGNALAWWKAYKQAKGGDVWLITVTWAEFKKLFFLQFFPRAEQERLKRESTLNHLMCIQFADVAQVANAARNYEILHERDDDDAERPDKRQKSGDRHQPTTQQSSHRNHGHNDRHGSDRRGGGDNHCSSNNNYSRNNNRETGVSSPTDLPILVFSSPGVPLKATPTRFALCVDADTQESVVELLSCGKGAHTGYNCPPKVPIISNPEPCNQTINNKIPQTLPSFDSVPCVSKPNFVDESSNIFNPPPQHPIYSCELCGSNAQNGHYCTPQAPFNNPE